MKTKNISLRMQPVATLFLLLSLSLLNGEKVMAAPTDEGSDYSSMQNRSMETDDMHARMSEDSNADRIDAKGTLRAATEVYTAMVKEPNMRVPESVLQKAKCVVVIPDVVTGALIVGGSHGAGVVSCREDNTWSEPAFLKLNALSFGAQIGGKTSDLVLFMVSDKAITALKRGNVELGSDVSVTAGTFDRALDTSRQGVIAYARTSGAFMGASISGARLSADEENSKAFYGEDASFASLLRGKVGSARNTQADMFTELLPK